ncbi:hypothetical protein GQO11_06165 [Acinetobacter johnsonii]|uniref:hypothetical protein n=1 Tax=Acinetobacter johnsonii TaxID=40214 RepID=UPI0013209244|nr:hypothetical protein [Acinetobacter johnsonii]MWC18252.1 hypothetical protein [Acinetobacter johnsonii]
MKATRWVLHEPIYCGSTQIRSNDEATWMLLFHCMVGTPYQGNKGILLLLCRQK